MHHKHGEYISVDEILGEVHELVEEDDGGAIFGLNMILDVVDFVVWMHGTNIDFHDIAGEDLIISKEELADARLRRFAKYDEDGDGLDAEEFFMAKADGIMDVDEDGEAFMTDQYYDDIEEYKYLLDEEGLMGGNEMLEEQYNYDPDRRK